MRRGRARPHPDWLHCGSEPHQDKDKDRSWEKGSPSSTPHRVGARKLEQAGAGLWRVSWGAGGGGAAVVPTPAPPAQAGQQRAWVQLQVPLDSGRPESSASLGVRCLRPGFAPRSSSWPRTLIADRGCFVTCGLALRPSSLDLPLTGKMGRVGLCAPPVWALERSPSFRTGPPPSSAQLQARAHRGWCPVVWAQLLALASACCVTVGQLTSLCPWLVSLSVILG